MERIEQCQSRGWNGLIHDQLRFSFEPVWNAHSCDNTHTSACGLAKYQIIAGITFQSSGDLQFAQLERGPDLFEFNPAIILQMGKWAI